jgi:hypothetical protein
MTVRYRYQRIFFYTYFNFTIIRIGLLCTLYAISEKKNGNSGTAAYLLKMEAGELLNLSRPDLQEFKTFEMEAMRLLLL